MKKPTEKEIGANGFQSIFGAGNLTFMKKFLPILIAFAAAYVYSSSSDDSLSPTATPDQTRADSGYSTTTALVSGTQAQGSGIVVRVLSDDNDGSRHQRFILKLNSGRTLLVAHNIDLAPRISGLRQGDTVEFNGEYESNSQGGVIHWTHRDPSGGHVDGWLKHDGRTYQ